MSASAGVLLAPYSTLLVQVIAVVLAGALLQHHFRGALSVAVMSAGLAIVIILTASGVWGSAAGGGDTQRQGLMTPPGVAYEEKCLLDQSRPQLVELTRLLREILPADAVYAGVSDPCVAYQLLPRVPARPGQAADWEVFTEELPPDALQALREERGVPPADRTVVATPAGLGARRLTGGGP